MEVSFIEEIDSSEEVGGTFSFHLNFSQKRNGQNHQIKERVSKDEYYEKQN